MNRELLVHRDVAFRRRCIDHLRQSLGVKPIEAPLVQVQWAVAMETVALVRGVNGGAILGHGSGTVVVSRAA